ncbi:MAG: DUF4350 domain-containing protein [Fimbriimonadales bacterium]|nr:DUF4350 domain-containing protein [Fimbriimonadales bacterium]
MAFLRERWALIVMIGIVAWLVLYMRQLAQEAYDPRFAPRPLSYSRHRHGVKGFARLLERNGYTVRSLKRTYRHLPHDAAMLVIFPLPLFADTELGEWKAEDAEALEAWLNRGGRLLLFSSDPRLPEPLRENAFQRLPMFQIPIEWSIDTQPALPAPWLEGIRVVRLRDQRVSLSPREQRWTPLLHAGGAIEGALWHYGDGIVFECTDWYWLTNECLCEADNGAFILAVVRKMLPQGGVVYFDDAGQGDLLREYTPRGFWGVAPTGVRVAFAHLLVLTAVVMYSVGKRFGLPCPTLPPAPAFGEYVDALAGVYERAQAAQPALEAVMDDIRRRLCQRFGLPAGATLLQLIQSLPADSALRAALAEAHYALQRPDLTPNEAVRTLKRLDEMLHRG